MIVAGRRVVWGRPMIERSNSGGKRTVGSHCPSKSSGCVVEAGFRPAQPRADVQTDMCWWCNSGERQSRHHLFVKCRAWEVQIRELWRSVGKACAPTARLLFRGERATPAVLQFLRDTKAGRMVTLEPCGDGEE